MGAFKLETFEISPGSGGLEDMRSAILERERNEAYAKGFKDGVNVTKSAVDVERNTRLGAIEEALSDMAITHEEASVAISRSLAPLVHAFFESLAPTLAHAGFTATVASQIETAVRSASKAGLRVMIAEDGAHAIRQDLADRAIEVEVETDPTLGPLDAEVHWDGGVDIIRLGETLSEITDHLKAHLGDLKETDDDGRQRTG